MLLTGASVPHALEVLWFFISTPSTPVPWPWQNTVYQDKQTIFDRSPASFLVFTWFFIYHCYGTVLRALQEADFHVVPFICSEAQSPKVTDERSGSATKMTDHWSTQRCSGHIWGTLALSVTVLRRHSRPSVSGSRGHSVQGSPTP